MRWRRKRRVVRAARKSLEMQVFQDNTARIRPRDILLVSTMRNEYVRLPYFMSYYRDLGVGHFLFVDNDSTDGTLEYLSGQPDVSIWTTKASYKKATYGVDWVNWINRKYAHGHWTLVVDPDEFFIYPFCDTRP
ncbi:MAG: glycosyltransferase family 2 protein, partial [Arenibacterium sp.]